MKKKLDPAKQVIAYTSELPPRGLPGDQALNNEPIKIEIAHYREKLDPASRIDLENLHNVEHNISICHVGNVKKADLRRLMYHAMQSEQKPKLVQALDHARLRALGGAAVERHYEVVEKLPTAKEDLNAKAGDQQLGFKKKAYMSLDALLTDESLGIIPDWFECDWEIPKVLKMNPCYKDPDFSIAKVLRSLIVLTGDRSSFEATGCEEYIKGKWGYIGLDLLESVVCRLDSADSRKCESL